MSSASPMAAYMATAKLQYVHSVQALGNHNDVMCVCITVEYCHTAQFDATAANVE